MDRQVATYEALAAFLLLWGCGREPDSPAADPPLRPQERSAPTIRFADVTAAAGIHFKHTSGLSGRKYGVETLGSGAAFFDYNGDGYMDLYVVNGADLPGHISPQPPRNALYRNRADGRFVETAAGVADTSYGMGCSAGDYDNDGDADLFVANFGTNVLYRNEGGRFADVTAAAIPDSDLSWSTGSAFADYDLDGDLDLYVANYLDYQFETDPLDETGCLKKDRRHYAPTEYPGRRDFLYRNEADGRFVDVTEEAGLFSLEGRELGAVFFDWDGDGDPDLFQANDATPNFLYRNEGNGSFSEIGLAAGAAYNEAGKPEGGMGTDIADTDGDGHLEIVVTNFQWESNTLYQSKGDGLWRDRSTASGLGAPSFDRLAFGVNFFDIDRDGDPDLYVANGHIDENIADFDPQVSHGQRDQLFLNDGEGRFAEISAQAGPFFQRTMVGRGSATADYDNDGDGDLFVVNSNQPAVLLRNDTASANHWLALRLVGTRSNRDGLGSRVTVQTGDREQTQQTRSSFSYLSQSDPRLFFGLGAYDRADRIDIAWPSGIRQQLKDVEADQLLEILEPTEPVADHTGDSIHKSTLQAGEHSTPPAFELEQFWREAPPVLIDAGRFAPPDGTGRASVEDVDALTAAVASSPRDPDAHFRLAEALHQLRRYEAAEVHYQKAVALDSSHAQFYTGLGKLYGDQGDRTKALAVLQRALALGDEAIPHYYLGNFYASQGSYQQAILHYQQAIERRSNYEQAYVNLAGVHARQTEYSTAIQVLTRGVDALPGSAELKFRLGWNYFVQGRYAAALEQFQQVVRLDPQRHQAYDFMARIYMAQEKGEEAQQLLRQALSTYPDASALLVRLGGLLLDAGDPVQASEYLERAIRSDPDRAEAYYNLGQAYLRIGLSDRGHAVLRYFELLQTNYQELLDLKTAIVLNPSDATACFGLGKIYGRIGRYEAARQSYLAVLKIVPSHIDAQNNLGNIYLRQQRPHQAIQVFSALLQADSSYVRAYNNLGYAYLAIDQPQRAIQTYKKAIAIDPQYAQAYSSLGAIYMQQGRIAEAQQQLAIYEELTGSSP